MREESKITGVLEDTGLNALEERLIARNRVLAEYVRHLGNMSDTCTYSILNRICDYCECSRQQPPG